MPEIWSRFFDQVYDPLACNPWAYLRVTLICMELYQELYPVCRSRMMSKLGFGWEVRLVGNTSRPFTSCGALEFTLATAASLTPREPAYHTVSTVLGITSRCTFRLYCIT